MASAFGTESKKKYVYCINNNCSNIKYLIMIFKLFGIFNN